MPSTLTGLPYPAPGDVADVPYWNQALAEAVEDELTRIDSAAATLADPAACVMSNTGTQSIPANTTTLVLLNTVVLDKGTISPLLSSDRIKIDVPGIYVASAMLPWQNVTGTSGYRGAIIYKNSAETSAEIIGVDYRPAPDAGLTIHSVTSMPFSAVAGDYVDLHAYHTDTVARSITATNGGPWLALHYLRA